MSGTPPKRQLGRGELKQAYAALEQRLAARGVKAHVYVIGGAAKEVARDLKLRAGWLNDEVKTVVPVVPDRRAPVLYDSPHLIVTGASSSHLLAMKAHSALGVDEDDIKWLMNRVGVRTLAGLEDVHRGVFGDEPIPQRAYRRLGELLGGARREDRLHWSRQPRGRGDGPER